MFWEVDFKPVRTQRRENPARGGYRALRSRQSGGQPPARLGW